LKILVVTEKPKMARALATALGRYRVERSGGLSVYSVQREGDEVRILPLSGHIMQVETAEPFRRWDSVDPLDIVSKDEALIKVITRPDLASRLREEAKRADRLIVATDPDEEGENIGFEAVQLALEERPGLRVDRLWLPSMRSSDIRARWGELTKLRPELAESVEARMYLDAMIGFSATRELTLLNRKGFSPRLLSVGRCQTAVLYLIYEREREIEAFKPTPYWRLLARLVHGEAALTAEHVSSPFFAREEAMKAHERARGHPWALITSAVFEERELLPPTPLNTSALLQLATREMRQPAARVMQLAEELYLQGYITYPRTDTDRYVAFNHASNLDALAAGALHGAYARALLERGLTKPREGRRYEGDHEPITPIRALKGEAELQGPLLQLYDLILRRYLALFGPPAKLNQGEALLQIGGETFRARGLRVLDEGFLAIYPFGRPEEQELPPPQGSQVEVKAVELLEEQTKPPPRYTEAALLKVMERMGIGTKSTRALHIETVVRRGYALRKGPLLLPTKLGYRLAHELHRLWPEFVRPSFSGELEKRLQAIARGQRAWKEVVSEGRGLFKEMMIKLRQERGRLQLGRGYITSTLPETEGEKSR
jgi:DNA topoisomerase-1